MEVEDWRVPTQIDTTKFVKAGQNVLAILAINLTDKPSPAGLIGKLTIEFNEGSPLVVRIGPNWKAANKEQRNWNQPNFDDKGWLAAKELGKYGCSPWGAFAERSPQLTISPVKSDPFCGHCEVPADMDLSKVCVYLEMDELTPEAAAHIRVNGEYAGGFIDKPFRLNVTRLLKPGNNTFVITPFAPKTARLVFRAN